MDALTKLITEVSAASYVGIFVIAMLANVVVPLPEEIVMLIIGYVVGTGAFSFWIAMPVVMAGVLASDLTMFLLSRSGNRAVKWFYNKFFANRATDNPAFLQKHVGKIVFFSRFLVQLRFLGPFLAGQAKISIKKFIAYDMLAIIIYVPLLLWAGSYFHSKLAQISSGIGLIRNIVLIVFGLIILYGIGRAARVAFLGTYAISFNPKEGYKKTWMPGLLKKADEKK